jgi:hypothetical protein
MSSSEWFVECTNEGVARLIALRHAVGYLAGRAVPSEQNDCRRRRSATERSCAHTGVHVGCQDIEVKYGESCEARGADESME